MDGRLFRVGWGGTAAPVRIAGPKDLGPAMNQGEWRLFRMRPANHPRRQLVGAAAILDRSLKQGLALGLGEITQGLSPAKLTGGSVSQAWPDRPSWVRSGQGIWRLMPYCR